jgi:putative hydrolase of the HAD superfamily
VKVVYSNDAGTTGMTILAVFFDMGGTIETFRFTREMRLKATSGFKRLLNSKGIDLHLSNNELFELISSGLDYYHKWAIDSLIELPPSRVWKEYILVDYPQFFPILDQIGEELMYWIETNYYERSLRSEIPFVLDKLSKMGMVIGLISNVCSLSQVPENLRKYGIIRYFDTIVTSSGYGRRKPDPSIFHQAAFLAKIPTSRCAYVGDRITRDIIGSKKAGFRLAIQITHDFEHGEIDEGAQPDAVIQSMDEIINIIQEENLLKKSSPSDSLPIKAFLFDAGDILYHRPKSGHHLRSFLNEIGLVDIEIPIDKKKQLRDQAYKGLISQNQQREEIMFYLGITDPQLVQRGCQALEDDDNNVIFFPGVQETLRTLKQNGFLLGIITDTANPISVKLRWFENGGFADVWDSIVSSHEIGIEKPDPKIYQAALDHLGLKPHQAVFVGHNPIELDGANKIGMTTVAFNQDPGAKADFSITHFNDLLSIQFMESSSEGQRI